MCNAYNLRHRNEAILDIARAMQLPLDDLPEFPPRHRIGIKQRGLILRPSGDGPLAWSWARWSLVPPGSKVPPAYPLNNARADKLGGMAVEGRPAAALPDPGERVLGAGEASQGAGRGALVLLQHDGRAAVLHGGPVGRGVGPDHGEVADTYTLIITDANAVMRVHDRMPVILATDAARRWVEPGPLPAELLVSYPAEEMTAWRVADDAKNSRIEPYPGMTEPVVPNG